MDFIASAPDLKRQRDELLAASLAPAQPDIALTLESATEWGTLGAVARPGDAGQARFAREIDAALASSQSHELFVYVHGAKVGFTRCTVRTRS